MKIMSSSDSAADFDSPSTAFFLNFVDVTHTHAHHDQESCSLLGRFGLYVQVVLALSIFTSLVFKWVLEGHPRLYRLLCCAKDPPQKRSLTVFILDISKQIISSTVAHILNITQAIFFRKLHLTGGANQCVWYLIGVSGDCFATTFLACYILYYLRPCLVKYYAIDVGEYDENNGNFSPGAWFQQTVLWCIIILQVRLVLLITVFVLRQPLYDAGQEILAPLDVKKQLITVLVIVPLIGNNVQFLIQDAFLRAKKKMDKPE